MHGSQMGFHLVTTAGLSRKNQFALPSLVKVPNSFQHPSNEKFARPFDRQCGSLPQLLQGRRTDRLEHFNSLRICTAKRQNYETSQKEAVGSCHRERLVKDLYHKRAIDLIFSIQYCLNLHQVDKIKRKGM